MKKDSMLGLLVFVFLLFLTSCDKEELQETDKLAQTSIYGQWKLDSREINGISPLIVECCDYITFSADNEPADLKGNFKASGAGYENIGTFELRNANQTIDISNTDIQKSYTIEISADRFMLSYQDDADAVVEYYLKE